MSIKSIDAHDRLSELNKTSDKITEAIQSCIINNPFNDYSNYTYIFAHKRKGDFTGEADRMIWQNRLTKPQAQTNSMLFKVYKNAADAIHIKWIIPPREQWECYKKGMMFENEVVSNSIDDFQNHRRFLEQKEKDDLCDEKIHEIYKEISRKARISRAVEERISQMQEI